MLNIVYIFLLILIFIKISPIIDHFSTDYDESKSVIEIIIEIVLQLFIIGAILHLFYLLNQTKFIKDTFKLNQYDRVIIDLIFTIIFIGTQSNLSKKLQHITRIHPVRNIF